MIHLRQLAQNNVGSSLVLFGLSLPVLMSALALGVDYAIVVRGKSEIGYLSQLACNQLVSSNYSRSFANRREIDTKNNFYGMARADKILKNPSISIIVEKNGTDMAVTTGASVETYFAKLFGVGSVKVSSTSKCNVPKPATGPGFAFCDGFENPKITRQSTGWDFYKSLPGWKRYTGNNLELQNINSGGAAAEGEQYTELDADRNAGMEQTFNLNRADFEINFLYRSETWNSTNLNSHGIGICLEKVSAPRCTNQLVELKQITDWQEVKKSFKVVDPGQYRLSVFATGISDGTGGQLDNFRLTEAGAKPAKCS